MAPATTTSPNTCYVFFSTQSGRAKACARRCTRRLRDETTTSVVVNGGTLDEAYDHAEFADRMRREQACLILFISTTGDGEHTATIQRTWKHLLQKSLPSNHFIDIPFAIFNLGDRAYGPKFCAAGRKLTVRLLQLGATLFGEAGYGDDGTPGGGVFADLDLWLNNSLIPLFGAREVAAGPLSPSDATLQTPIRIVQCDDVPCDQSKGSSDELFQFKEEYDAFFQSVGPPVDDSAVVGMTAEKAAVVANVLENRRLTSPKWNQDTRHLRLRMSDSASSQLVSTDALPYCAGDVASILPVNDTAAVERFLSVLPNKLRAQADEPIRVSYNSNVESTVGVGYCGWPERFTLRGWLTYCADIAGLPDREDLRALSHFCSPDHEMGSDQRSKLVALSETTESALYVDYILREKRNWAEVLYDFDSIRAEGSLLTREFLLALLSPLRPRDFSIASSPTEMKQEGADKRDPGTIIELCVAVVQGKTPLGREYFGLCSKYLSSLDASAETSANACVRLWIRSGSFRGLPNGNIPVLCIGSGTGVAPLRGLLRERIACNSQQSREMEVKAASSCENCLVFGCRKAETDFYYRNEWEILGNENSSVRILTAFSRDQIHKIYVQQVLKKIEKEDGWLSRHILEHGGAVYIAGNPRMAKDVRDVVLESLSARVPGGQKKAQLILSSLQRKGAFSVEAW